MMFDAPSLRQQLDESLRRLSFAVRVLAIVMVVDMAVAAGMIVLSIWRLAR